MSDQDQRPPYPYQQLRRSYIADAQIEQDSFTIESLTPVLMELGSGLPVIFKDDELSCEKRVGLVSFTRKLADYIKSLLSSEGVNLTLVNERKTERTFKEIPYSKCKDIKVPIPKGLSSNYEAYLTTLLEIQDLQDNLIERVIKPYERYIGTLLNQPGELSSQRHSELMAFYQSRPIEDRQEKLSAHFSRDQAERRRYAELIERQAQWSQVAKMHNELVTRTQQTGQQRIEDVLEDTLEITDELIGYIEKNPERYALAGVSAKDLMHLTYAVANEIEFFSIFRYAIEELSGSIQFCIKEIPKRAK